MNNQINHIPGGTGAKSGLGRGKSKSMTVRANMLKSEFFTLLFLYKIFEIFPDASPPQTQDFFVSINNI